MEATTPPIPQTSTAEEQGYLPIEDYGRIGNMRTSALVGKNGSIDWLCLPRFDSASVFAAVLDAEKGGRFQIAPIDAQGLTQRQLYWPETNVLITRFLAPGGVAEVIDYMPVGAVAREPGAPLLIRRVEVVRGRLQLGATCRPAFNYARDEHRVTRSDHRVTFQSPQQDLVLFSADLPLDTTDDGGARADLDMAQGDRAVFALYAPDGGESRNGVTITREAEQRFFNETVAYWHRWLSQCTYTGRWRDQVYRSALALKLMTYEPTGAIVAAPTCSLPEGIGGVRNWDYRYTWMRDAAFTVYGLLRIGFTEEAGNFMKWLEKRCHERGHEPLQIVYGIDGRIDLTEKELPHLEGYRGSKPVRIGNGAYDQHQLDIYGELLDAAYLSNKYGAPVSYDTWLELDQLVDWVCEHWQKKDRGIWEGRGEDQHHVYSKLMCWVAVDRGLRLANKRSFPADRDRWIDTRDDIYEQLQRRGWSAERGAFVQHYGSTALDASNLIMPLVFFMAPNDPRMLQTLDAIRKSPQEGGLVSDSLIHRYHLEEVDDGLPGEEGTFNMCTFWLVEALTRAGATDAQYLHDGRLIFEKMLSYANQLGLYAEETGPCGEALGNFPQAFTHLGLISAAFNLDRALEGKRFGVSS